MKFQEELQELNLIVPDMPKPKQIEQFMSFLLDLTKRGVAASAPKPGDKAQSFALPNAVGNTVALSDFLARSPVVVKFHRGRWCPYCGLALGAMQRALPEMKALGASFVAISPRNPDNSLSTKEKAELEFEVLSDIGNQVAREYELVFFVPPELRPYFGEPDYPLPEFNDDDSWELPTPATFVINRNGSVSWAFVDVDVTKRADPDEVLAALRRLAH